MGGDICRDEPGDQRSSTAQECIRQDALLLLMRPGLSTHLTEITREHGAATPHPPLKGAQNASPEITNH